MDFERRNTNGYTHENLSIVESNEVGDITEWMLLEVLMRLPFKVLFKLKIVSKQWHSMISDPSFARMYAARTSLSPHSQRWILISCFAREPMIEQFFGKELSPRGYSLGMNCLDLLTLPEEVHDLCYIIVGISNGLVLYGPRMEYQGRIHHSYDIYNPITRQWITLPPHKHWFMSVATGFVTQVEGNILTSFRVVHIDATYRKSSGFRFEVYFSEIRKWVYYSIYSNQEFCFSKRNNPVVLDKILHWNVSGHIMAYDPYNKPDFVRLILLPIDSKVDKTDSGHILFDKHQGHLRYFELLCGRQSDFFRGLSIWILNDYNLGEWCLQHRVIFDDIQFDGYVKKFLVPLSFHPFDSNIVYMVNKECLLSYNIKTGKLEHMDDLRESDLFRLAYFWSYFLFVIPPWPVLINPSSFTVPRD